MFACRAPWAASALFDPCLCYPQTSLTFLPKKPSPRTERVFPLSDSDHVGPCLFGAHATHIRNVAVATIPSPKTLCVCVCVCVLCSSWGAFEETFQLNVFRTFHSSPPCEGRLSLDFRPVECFSMPCRFYSTMASSTDVGHRFWSSGLFVFPTTSTPTRTPQHKPHCSNSLPE